MLKLFTVILEIFFMSIVILTSLDRQSVDIAFKKRQIKIGFRFIGTFSWGSLFQALFKLFLIFKNLEFDLKFTFAISVADIVDNVNVKYACIIVGSYVNQILHLKVGVHGQITSSYT